MEQVEDLLEDVPIYRLFSILAQQVSTTFDDLIPWN